MIATVAFFAKGPVLESMLVGDMWMAAMCEGVGEVFAGTGAWFEDMEFVSGVWWGMKKGTEEAWLLWGVQCW